MTTLTLTLPRPHPAQRRILREAARFNVLACGRRFGKSTLGLDRAAGPILEGYPVGWFAPTYKMLTEVWRDAVRVFRPVTSRVNVAEHRLELLTGGVFEMWSLDTPDVARGRKYRRVLLDEAAMVRELSDAWQQVIRPTLADYTGDAWFFSTPKGFNDFYTLWERGQGSDEGWRSWQMPTADNPFIAADEIAAMRLELPGPVYEQEILARFVALDSGTFKREWFATYVAQRSPVGTWVRFWDLATSVKQGADYTVGALVGLLPDGTLCIADVVRGRWEWPDARKVILATAQADGPGVTIGIEQVAFQLAAVQELRRDPALLLYKLKAAVPDRDKQARALPWAGRAEAGLVSLVRAGWNSAFLAELADFPAGTHDDQVDAVSGAVTLLAHTRAPLEFD